MTTSLQLPTLTTLKIRFASNAFIHSVCVWLVTWKNGCCYFARLNFNFLACGQIQTTFLILVLFSSCLQHLLYIFCLFLFYIFFVWLFVELFSIKIPDTFVAFEPVSSENTRPYQKKNYCYDVNVYFGSENCHRNTIQFRYLIASFSKLFQKCTEISLFELCQHNHYRF